MKWILPEFNWRKRLIAKLSKRHKEQFFESRNVEVIDKGNGVYECVIPNFQDVTSITITKK